MKTAQFSVTHVELQSDEPFDEVAKRFELQLGQYEPGVTGLLAQGGNVEEVRTKIEAMALPSGVMLFSKTDHGALLRLAGQQRKATQYVVGNPLLAFQMTRHDIRAGLYAPLRVMLYENQSGKTYLEYDRPSSLFGQFGNAEINVVADLLDRKLAALAAAAMG